MNSEKHWYHSTAIWGSIVSAASFTLGLTKGFALDATTQALIVDQVVAAISVSGALIGNFVAIYGRLAATKMIK